ncbi:MAG: glycosyltransferase [Blastocatellia bacterium]|nr:glycosyltransferase [Blastocatellia bacterium]
MKKILVYSHDTFGLGNIRRMLSISQHLIETVPDVAILLVTGSPMIQSFRLPAGLDYIKLPCLSRTASESYAVKSLGTALEDLMQLRADLLLTAVINFKPDLLLVDKKPFGVKNELEPVLRHLRACRPRTKNVLVLRDILDSPEATIPTWAKNEYHSVIEEFYDEVHVLGSPGIFDLRREYKVPRSVAKRFRFCGYTMREPGRRTRREIREELSLSETAQLALVTPGGGEDGYRLLDLYLNGLELPEANVHHSLIICGPEMRAEQREALMQKAGRHSRVQALEFTDDLMSYLDAADVVISMGGYNTVCEILSLKKRAIVVPRVRPVAEQGIRAERMARKGLFKTIHPDQLTAAGLMRETLRELAAAGQARTKGPSIDLSALPQISIAVQSLLARREEEPAIDLYAAYGKALLNRMAFAGTA